MSTKKVASKETSSGEAFLSAEAFLLDPEAQKRCLEHKLTTHDEANLRRAHKELTGTIFEKRCSNCFEDAFFMLLNILKTKGKMGKFNLKNGAVIFVDNKPYTNKNITDEIALQHFLERPNSKMFTTVPTADEIKSFKASLAGKKGNEAKNAKKLAEEEAAAAKVAEEAAKDEATKDLE